MTMGSLRCFLLACLALSPAVVGHLGHSHLHHKKHMHSRHHAEEHTATMASQAHFQRTGRLARRQDEPDDSDDFACTASKGCKIGCCGPLDDAGNGVCGLGPNFCGEGCTSSCHYKSECDPGWGAKWSNATDCPLNVCCSAFGFCGTTAGFCGGAVTSSPECAISAGTSNKRTIGYYEGWNSQRDCGHMTPDEIPKGYYTHLFFSFSLINPKTFRLEPMDDITGTLYGSLSALKKTQPELQVWLAIGGWAMNDPGAWRTTFSDLAADENAQDAFFESLVTFMARHNYDGVDIDWEYPVAEDRGGKPEDFDNFVNFMRRLRERLNATGTPKGLSLTLPASYWYLKGFDIVNLEPHIDFFNVMTYDIHGVWDKTISVLGPYAHAHTNLTEIEDALKLLWRNNINPERVNLGLGFYGRSFTMKDPGCMSAGCEFTEGGNGGACTGTAGVLSAHEISQIIAGGATMTLDPVAGVQIVTWDENQWVSWDDTTTLKMKVDYANQRCLGGVMVWAVDLDDGTLIKSLAETGRATTIILDKEPDIIPCFGSDNWQGLGDNNSTSS
ncbi:glycoside hydrolase superfamily [Apodospora peruviana]|uniref:chitinase n=1 Tax=Apodospora peruviana TaxID=516989 RepID=A0AAE0HUU4_9PEZI|nr:glycoside hydrolase superfamily [Apodospora peruviana]